MDYIEQKLKEFREKFGTMQLTHPNGPDVVSLQKDVQSFLRQSLIEAKAEGAREREKKYADIFSWLQGLNGDFPDLSQKPHYSFRTELRKRLASITS